MSHSKTQRKDWHRGKRRSGESLPSWFRRVMRGGITPSAYTPPQIRRGITYSERKK